MEKLTHNFRHYSPLIGILLAGFAGFLIFSFDRNFQFVVALAVSLGYVSWGIVHHYLHKDLYPEVVFEYFVIAALGLVLVYTVLFRA